LSIDGFALTCKSEIVFAQQIAVLEMPDDLIRKALKSHMLDRAQLGQHVDQLALSGDIVLQLAGFERPELTVALVDDGPGPMWGDICAAKARNQHSCIVRLAGPSGESTSKAICYVEVNLPAFASSASD
jgi:hypothetical protein